MSVFLQHYAAEYVVILSFLVVFRDSSKAHVSDKMYAQPMEDSNFERLHEQLSKVEGKWLMSHSDDDFVRDVFSDFEIAEIETVYTMANGNNQSYKRCRNELLIANYSIPSKH